MIFIVMIGNDFTFDAEVLSAKAIPLVIDVEMVTPSRSGIGAMCPKPRVEVG